MVLKGTTSETIQVTDCKMRFQTLCLRMSLFEIRHYLRRFIQLESTYFGNSEKNESWWACFGTRRVYLPSHNILSIAYGFKSNDRKRQTQTRTPTADNCNKSMVLYIKDVAWLPVIVA